MEEIELRYVRTMTFARAVAVEIRTQQIIPRAMTFFPFSSEIIANCNENPTLKISRYMVMTTNAHLVLAAHCGLTRSLKCTQVDILLIYQLYRSWRAFIKPIVNNERPVARLPDQLKQRTFFGIDINTKILNFSRTSSKILHKIFQQFFYVRTSFLWLALEKFRSLLLYSCKDTTTQYRWLNNFHLHGKQNARQSFCYLWVPVSPVQ